MLWIMTSQMKINVFIFVSEETDWIVEGTESEKQSDIYAARWDMVILGWDTARLGVWWPLGETMQDWEYGGHGVRHCKTGSMVIFGWGTARLGVWWYWGETLQDWEYGDLGVRLCKTGHMIVLGWDTAKLGVWWSWSTDSNSECSESNLSVSVFLCLVIKSTFTKIPLSTGVVLQPQNNILYLYRYIKYKKV